MSERFATILPSAGRLMGSLRDIGYDLPGALADLVDNSIDASAKNIAVEICPEGAVSWIRVSDDGIGMSPSEVDEAMRYGSHATYAETALGHFGLGLKTASLSQCRRLTVASRRGPRGRISIRRWDLDTVLARDSWDLESLPASQAPAALLEALPSTGGTVVLWESLDRLLPRRQTDGLVARVLNHRADEVREHLAMVFHRFLDGEAFDDRSSVTLTVNGERVEPWDPFARDEPQCRALAPQQLLVGDDGAELQLDVQPYVLPSQHAFSSPEAHRRAAGPNRWNRHQGFYIYRRDRLIQAGGWNRLRTLDEHAKLARIAVDLPIGHEDRFAVDVAKMRIVIPEELRGPLRAIASGAVSIAQERYRDHLDQTTGPIDNDPPTADAISISRDWPAILLAVDDVLGSNPGLRDQLLLRLSNADPRHLETH